ncbi:hypothetical protein Tco_0739856 [Tanacetum coccineum]
MQRVLRVILGYAEHQSDTKVFTMKMEIFPWPTSNKLCGLYSEAQAGEVGFWHDLHDGLREKTEAFFSYFSQVLEMSLCEGSVTKLGHVGHYLSSRSKRRLGSRWMRTVMGGSRNVYSAPLQYLFMHDHLRPHMQIDPFPGRERDYPPIGYTKHMPLGYEYRYDIAPNGSS